MKCPKCDSVNLEPKQIVCDTCKESFDRSLIKELEHLVYMQAWSRQNLNFLTKPNYVRIQNLIAERITKLEEHARGLALPGAAQPAAPAAVSEPATKPRQPLAGGTQTMSVSAPLQPDPAVSTAVPAVPHAAPQPVSQSAARPVSQPVSLPAARPVRPAPAPRLAKPPKPPVDWAKARQALIDAAVSGALLRGLLYLGAFMFVVSAAVLVISFWAVFPFFVQLLFISSVPAAFYAGGWLLRSKLKLVQAGGVLLGIGEILVAVDFAAIYQIGGLAQSSLGNLYWLAASSLCTALYAFTAWRMAGEFYDHLALLAGTGAVFALTRVLNLPLEWGLASVAASAAAMCAAAFRLTQKSETSRDFLHAARLLPQVILPLSAAASLFFPVPSDWARAATFLMASVGYGLLAWRFPGKFLALGALGMPLGLVYFSLGAVSLPPEWYPAAAAILSAVYLAGAYRAKAALDEKPAFNGYTREANAIGLGLLGLGGVGAVWWIGLNLWAAAAALTLVSAVLMLCAASFRRPVLVLAGSGLFLLPFSLGFLRILSDRHVDMLEYWLPLGWGLVALAYLAAGAVLRRLEPYVRWLYLCAHGITVLGLLTALVANSISRFNLRMSLSAASLPPAASLAAFLLVYLVSAVLHDGDQHPALSGWLAKLPAQPGKSIFAWAAATLAPIWLNTIWNTAGLARPWFGLLLAICGIGYIAAGLALQRRKAEYRLPLHALAYLLAAAGILTSWPDSLAAMLTLLTTVAALVWLALIYNRVIETSLASLLLLWPLELGLQRANVAPFAHLLGFALLGVLGYTTGGVLLRRSGQPRLQTQAAPLFWTANGLAAVLVVSSIGGRFLPGYIPWVGAAVALLAAGVMMFNTAYFRRGWFAWASALAIAIAFGQSLTTLRVDSYYLALCWAGLGMAYILVERSLHAIAARQESWKWTNLFLWPAVAGTALLSGLGYSLTYIPFLTSFSYALSGLPAGTIVMPLFFAELLVVLAAITGARLYKSRLPLFVEPYLTYMPVTFFFMLFGKGLFGAELVATQYAVVWAVLGAAHFIAAALLDHKPTRYAQGLYLGSAFTASAAVVISAISPVSFIWVFGIWIVLAAASAVLVHLKQQHTWEDLLNLVLGKTETAFRQHVRNAFQWAAAWAFPLWLLALLNHLRLVSSFLLLAFVGPALAYLGLVLWLRRLNPTYKLAFHSAAQVYTAAALAISAPATWIYLSGQFSQKAPDLYSTILGCVIVQAGGVLFYLNAAWINQRRVFAHAASWLSFFPFTLDWMILTPGMHSVQFALPWLGLAALALAAGYALDNLKIRYAHGPYLFGYILAVFALVWSTSAYESNIAVLAGTIGLAAASHIAVQRGRHHSFEDFIRFFFGKTDPAFQRILATLFIFFAAFTLPVLITQIQALYAVPLAWRGVSLALAAPLYIACGLFIRRFKSRGALQPYSTWPLYTMGYLLTAIGAMITFQDERLAIYVLFLDALVYAVSAYIFQDPIWLYISGSLAPVVLLLTLHTNDLLNLQSAAGSLAGLAFVYLGAGLWFDRRARANNATADQIVARFGVPFYHLAFVLMPVALAVCSALPAAQKGLAAGLFALGAAFYACMAWLWKETLLVYPAAWLAAVPYYLLITLTPLDPAWYGLAWLPLIAAYIATGRLIFHRSPIPPLRRQLFKWLEHPAMPFYLLAYPLSVSMILQPGASPLTLTLAYAAAACLYALSAFVFRTPAWFYPGLLAANLTLLAYLGMTPSDLPFYAITIPFLGVNALLVILGFVADRLTNRPAAEAAPEGLWRRLYGHAWTRPFFLFACLEFLLWQAVALQNPGTTIILGLGHALLLGLLAQLWSQSLLTYGVYAFGLLSLGGWLNQQGVPFATGVSIFGGAGFGLYLLSWLLETLAQRLKILDIWVRSGRLAALALATGAMLVNLPLVQSQTTPSAISLGFAGALYITIAYRTSRYRLSYLGMALLEISWALLLVMFDIRQPQLYAIPAGLYFAVIGYLERKHGRTAIGAALEIFGFAVLLVTSFIQSVNTSDSSGIIYFVLLLAEGLILTWLGVVQQRKIPFGIGLGASALNVLAQVVVLVIVYDINRWFVALGTGAFILLLAVLVEMKREQIKVQSSEWLANLDQWSR